MPWQGRDIGQFQQGHGGHLTLVDEALEDSRREVGEPQLSSSFATTSVKTNLYVDESGSGGGDGGAGGEGGS